MIDLGLLEQQAPIVRRPRTQTNIIKPFADVADLREKQFNNQRAQHDADLADNYREALKTHDPQDLGGIQGLREDGFGPESIPLGENESTRQEKEKQNQAVNDLKQATLDNTDAYRTGILTDREQQRKDTEAKNAIDEKHWKDSNALEWWKAQHPQAQANASQRDIISLRSQADKSAKPYTTGKDAYAQAIEEYNNLAKNPNGLDAKANQQGIIDKYITSSTGKATTQEQFKSLVDQSPGIENYLNNIGGKIKVGKLLPNAMVNALMRNMRDYQLGLNQNLKQRNDDFSREAQIRGIDPAGLTLTPNDRLTSDSADYATHLYGNEALGKEGPKPSFINRIFGTTPDEPITPIKRAGSNRGPKEEAKPAPAADALKSAGDAVYGTDGDVGLAMKHISKHRKAP